MLRGPRRREIGHGRLARGAGNLIPDRRTFLHRTPGVQVFPPMGRPPCLGMCLHPGPHGRGSPHEGQQGRGRHRHGLIKEDDKVAVLTDTRASRTSTET